MLTHKNLSLLIIEDNPGDAFLIKEYLNDVVSEAVVEIVATFEKAKAILALGKVFDTIFLDLSLPDHSGEALVKDVVALANLKPVIVLTGYSNQEFGVKTLSLGVSDYLLKDELSLSQLTKSLTYSIERRRIEQSMTTTNERYEILAKATSDTIWDWDINKKTVVSNQGITRVFGYHESKIEHTEKWWRRKIHPDDFRGVMTILNENFANGNPVLQMEYRFQCADGSYKYVLDRAFLILDSANKPIRMIGAMQDITKKKEEEQRLRLLESVVTQANDAILITEIEPVDNAEPKVVYVNEAFTKMTGLGKEDVLGKNPKLLQGITEDDDELYSYRASLEKRETNAIEILNYRKNGEQFWSDISVTPVADRKGWFTHWISIQRDVTDRRKYLHEIEEQNKKLKEIAWIQSHIVRAPLARIMGMANLLAEKIPIEGLNESDLINNIAASAEELDKIIRDIVRKTETVQNQH